jgi:hypothetical protein
MIDAAPPKPFVVDARATMLKKHPQLSKHARNLYMTLRALADGKTGELRINGRWLKATVFDRAAEMCRDIRMRSMRELIALGLVTLERPRVWRMIGGRMRAVLAEAHYTVHREPVLKNHQKAEGSSKVDLLKSISSTVEEIDSQYVSKPPLSAASVPVCFSKGSAERAHHHHHATDEDDCSPSLREKEKPKSTIQTKGPVDEGPRAKDIPLPLRRWMDVRILARARDPVRSPSAYLRASRASFLENMADEIELFLTEAAQQFMRQRIDIAGVVKLDDVYDLLKAEVKKRALPIDELDDDPFDVFWRVIDSASEILGLKDADEGE